MDQLRGSLHIVAISNVLSLSLSGLQLESQDGLNLAFLPQFFELEVEAYADSVAGRRVVTSAMRRDPGSNSIEKNISLSFCLKMA